MAILHPLSDFIENYTVSNSSPSYYYQGRCADGVLKLPRTSLVEAIAHKLMQHLANDLRYSGEGKMYGILLIELPTGEQRIIKAFSGLLNGNSIVEGWVPPIPGRDEVALDEARTLAQLEAIKQEIITLKQLPQRQEYETLKSEFDIKLHSLSDRHQNYKQQRHEKRQILCETLTGEALIIALEQLDEESRQQKIERRHLKRLRDETLQPLQQIIETADIQIRELKQQRKQLSRQLQTQMHAAYTLVNFLGQSQSLQQLIPGGLPTGTGDCCAPKLLHYAATHNLKPLAMAEFWWGASSVNQDKIQGEFYGACVERCQPLMGFLLSGLRPNPPAPFPPSVGGEVLYHVRVISDDSHSHCTPHARCSTWSDTKTALAPLNPLPACGEGRQSVALAGWGSPGLVSNQADIILPIIYEDEWLIAVNKPPGLLSVPGRYRDRQDSVLTRLHQKLPDGVAIASVHRLDQETSGILLLARDRSSHRQLSQQFQQRQIYKVYEAVLSGLLTIDEGIIELPLSADLQNRPYQKVDERGKFSLTHFRVIAREKDYTRIEFIPKTGRTHQLRVHAADVRGLGVSILGDRLYGCVNNANRLHLHARELRFQHPQTGETLHLRVNTPF